MLESSLGAMHCAALATLPNFTYPADLFPSSKLFAADLSEPLLRFSGPWKMMLPTDPGVGAAPDPARLKQWAVQQFTAGLGA